MAGPPTGRKDSVLLVCTVTVSKSTISKEMVWCFTAPSPMRAQIPNLLSVLPFKSPSKARLSKKADCISASSPEGSCCENNAPTGCGLREERERQGLDCDKDLGTLMRSRGGKLGFQWPHGTGPGLPRCSLFILLPFMLPFRGTASQIWTC